MEWLFRSRPVIIGLGWLIWAYMALCSRTIKWQVEGLEAAQEDWKNNHSLIVAAWHSTILTLPTAWTRYMRHWQERPLPSAMLISLSQDGEPVAEAIRHLGLEAVRGSSTSKRKRKDKGGGAAIAETSRRLKAGGAVCMTPDGPRGPRQRAGLGPILIAKRTDAAILPYALATTPSKRLATWDRFQIPFPFTKGAIVFGKAITDINAHAAEDMRLRLERELNRITSRAEALCGAEHVEPAAPVSEPTRPADAA